MEGGDDKSKLELELEGDTSGGGGIEEETQRIDEEDDDPAEVENIENTENIENEEISDEPEVLASNEEEGELVEAEIDEEGNDQDDVDASEVHLDDKGGGGESSGGGGVSEQEGDSVEEVEGQQLEGEEEEMEIDEQKEDDQEEEDADGPPGQPESEEEIEGEEELDTTAESVENAEEGNQDDENVSSSAGGVMTRKRTLSQSSTEDGPKRKVGRNASGGAQSDGGKHDKYCWVCHKELPPGRSLQINCKLCPRSYHTKCMSMDYPNAKISEGDATCPCPECVVVMNAETIEFRSDAMKQLTLDQLMSLLKNICLRMRQTPGAEPFIQPVDPTDAEDYFDYIIYAMDIETLERNIKKRLYGSTEGFLADAQWLVHNSIVFNSASSQYTVAAKRLLKVCKQELTEIETCPECYTNAHEKHDCWFVEACKRPHPLVWAKLKGFPFWPAKAMKINGNDVDVRFFGQHDRAWVSSKDCFLYSEEMPAAPPKKNGPLLAAIDELTAHVEKLKEAHGPVVFSEVKTPIGPQLSVDQIRKMLPEYVPPEQANVKAQQATATAASATSNKSSTTNNNNNNGSNTSKVPPPTKKSPMTIRISSLKTNPTIVNISGMAAENSSSTPADQNRVVTRLTRKSSAAQQSQSTNVSESDQSNDEQQPGVGEAMVNEEEEEKSTNEAEVVVPDDTKEEEAEEEEEETPTVPKGSEILANALGGAVRRSTRGLSRSGDSNAATSESTTTSATPTLERRLTRGALKSTSTTDGADGVGDQVSDEQPPEAVLEAMGLSKKTKESPAASNQRSVVIKGEPADDIDMDESPEPLPRASNKSLMEQLSAHTTVKPGYRFNLSKDISISAVEGGGGDHQDDHDTTSQAMALNMRARRVNPAPTQRSVPQGIPMGAVGGGIRPRLPVNTTVNGQPQHRMFTGQQLRQMVRNARPQHILNPRTGQTVRITGGAPNRPVSVMAMRGQQQHILQNVQKSSKDGGAVVVESSSLVNPVQGPITLPGGTITVTPLTSLITGVPIATFDGVNGAQSGQQQVAVALKSNSVTSTNNIGIINVQPQQGGSTIVTGSAKGSKPATAALGSAQQRRNLMVSIPPSVNMHLQNLTKTMGDLVKSTVEQITLEIVDFCNNSQGKAENSRLQMEVDRLQTKLKQDVTDVKHNSDIAMRELRMTMENDKKRALGDLKRQMELDKQKAVEETKKKQWCAFCGREALFYCCWNTSYCGYPCQEEHWPTHMSSCSQSTSNSR